MAPVMHEQPLVKNIVSLSFFLLFIDLFFLSIFEG